VLVKDFGGGEGERTVRNCSDRGGRDREEEEEEEQGSQVTEIDWLISRRSAVSDLYAKKVKRAKCKVSSVSVCVCACVFGVGPF
jgi:hypothetical protein